MTEDEVRASAPAPNQVGERRDGGAEVRGIGLRWTEEGEGPLTVFAHGLGNDRWSLEDAGVLDLSPLVAGGSRLVRFDARGHGRSTGRRVPDDYRWPDLADDLLALLDLLSPDRPVRAFGASMGTGTLLHAVLKAPQRFDRLVLGCPPTAWETRAPQADLYRQGADLVEQHGAEAFARAMAAAPVPGPFRELAEFAPAFCVSDALLPSVLRGAAGSDLPSDDALRTLGLPVLVLSWSDDPGHPVVTGARLARLIDGAAFEVADTLADVRDWGSRAAAFLGS